MTAPRKDFSSTQSAPNAGNTPENTLGSLGAARTHRILDDSSDRNSSALSHVALMHDDGISIAVDPVALITTECITVTSAMRKHARWAQSSVSAILGGGGALDSGRNTRPPDHLKRGLTHTKSGSQSSRTGSAYHGEEDGLASRWGLRGKKGKSIQDNPLMSAFARLRSDLRGCTSESL